MNLKDIKPNLKVPEKPVTKPNSDSWSIHGDDRYRPCWTRTEDEKPSDDEEPKERQSRPADVAADLTDQLKKLPFHGYTDGSMTKRICSKCEKPIDRALGCCRLQAIWVCFECWDKMVKVAYEFPRKLQPPLMVVRPHFERKVDGHLGAIED